MLDPRAQAIYDVLSSSVVFDRGNREHQRDLAARIAALPLPGAETKGPTGATIGSERAAHHRALADLAETRAALRTAVEAADRFRNVLAEAFAVDNMNPGDDWLVAELRRYFLKDHLPEPTTPARSTRMSDAHPAVGVEHHHAAWGDLHEAIYAALVDHPYHCKSACCEFSHDREVAFGDLVSDVADAVLADLTARRMAIVPAHPAWPPMSEGGY